jgi:hypothetical protein
MMSETRHCCVFTATQANRAAGEAKNVKANMVGWNIQKNDHVDAQFSLSRTPFEKRMGRLRVTNTLHRWQDFDEDKSVTVLQNLELSQVLLDSE